MNYANIMGQIIDIASPFPFIAGIDTAKIPTLVILISGRPLHLEQCLMEKIDALVGAWLPGELNSLINQLLELVQSDPLFPLGYALTYHKDNSHD
ncbi:hypothetical protein ACSQ67_017604 [Phaseolus vulgaris]